MKPSRRHWLTPEAGERVMDMIAQRAVKFARTRNKPALIRMRNLARYVCTLITPSNRLRLTDDRTNKTDAGLSKRDQRSLHRTLH